MTKIGGTGGSALELLKRLLQAREALILIIVLIIGITLSFMSEFFLTPGNIQAVLLGLSVEAIIAAGMMILMISGGFDLSVGSTMALAGMICSLLLDPIGVFPAILAGLTIAVLVGVVNGSMVAFVGVNPFVATLAMMSIARGLVFIITEGRPTVGLRSDFTALGQGNLFGIQLPIIYMVVIMVIAGILLANFSFFKQNYYMGGNEKAARFSGIQVNKIKIINYIIVAALAGLAGIIHTARVGVGAVTTGTGSELRVISAVVIGGASLSGGEGTILGAFLGTLLMALITNALNLLGVSVYWQQFIIGVVLALAVVVDTIGKRRRAAVKT